MNEHRDQFLANMSEEFKNPLHGILNMSHSVLKRERHMLQERSIEELETVLSIEHRLTLRLNDLIDMMSLQEGSLRLQKKAVSIQPIVTGVLDMLQYSTEVKRIKMVNQIAKDFPPVIADESRLVQIVYNLLHNAVKYTDEGIISVRAFKENENALIVISDTGIGMDEDILKRLFRPYEQANANETMIEGGFGLGLSISKQLVELHGGTLEVSSAVGEGSTFTLSLKLAELKNEQDKSGDPAFEQSSSVVPPLEKKPLYMKEVEAQLATTQTSLSELSHARPRILMVDDDPAHLQVLEGILSPEDYDVTMVTSGKEALAMLDAQEWDLVISDTMMPQLSGYELTRLIRKRFTLIELPVLLLTSRSQSKDIQTGFLAGANDYVTKPVKALELRARIEALTTIKQMVQEQLRLEAAWLQAQIQPHFLFNALNAVAALSETALDKMHDLLQEFSDFLRAKFQFQNMDELVPIEVELSLVRSYLYIEKVRFEERLEIDWQVEDSDIKVPFLSIQPLVENAIRHGIMKRPHGGKVLIQVSNNKTHAVVSVEDDGVGMDDVQQQRILERKAASRSGVGLINTDQRLKRHFGTGLQIESEKGKGTKISFHVKHRNRSK
ncbi:ATP-binding protein [Bacillus sp. FSL K6-6483]